MRTLTSIPQHDEPKELKETEQYIQKLNIHFQSLCQELEKRVMTLESILKEEIDSIKE